MSFYDLQAATTWEPAHKLLSYRPYEDPLHLVRVWNTRAGYVPERIFLPNGAIARYAKLIDDPVVPGYRPQIGDMVVFDMDVAYARITASELAPKFWTDGTAFGRSAQLLFRSELEVVSYLFDNLLMDLGAGAPYVEIVDQGVAAARGWL